LDAAPPKVKRGFSLMPPPPCDEAEAKRFALRSDKRFKEWLADLDCKAQQFESLRREDF